jgi:hypothetical protein
MTKLANPSTNCKAKIDRVVVCSEAQLEDLMKGVPAFRIESDYSRRNVNAGFFAAPYGRSRQMVNDQTNTRLFVQYRPRFRRSANLRVAAVPDDRQGLRRRELELIVGALGLHRFSIIETALDFPMAAMNPKFVRKHVVCGKSRMRKNEKYPDAVWFGAPKSEHFVRCYKKISTSRFRMEVQFNGEAIKKYSLFDANAWTSLPEIMARHIGFYRVRWIPLTAYIVRHFRYPNDILRKAHNDEKNLCELLRFLRQISVNNPRRFLEPMPENNDIDKALKGWRRRWVKNR